MKMRYPGCDPQQLTVVNQVDGPLLVLAGPSSGKTRVLTERIRHLLTEVPGHFRVLALMFTSKAADEMKERLADLEEARRRAFIGTLHGFCLEALTERGKWVGVEGTPHIFEHTLDRRQVLQNAVQSDYVLSEQVAQMKDASERRRRIDSWLGIISHVKSHPITYAVLEDDEIRRVLEAYRRAGFLIATARVRRSFSTATAAAPSPANANRPSLRPPPPFPRISA